MELGLAVFKRKAEAVFLGGKLLENFVLVLLKLGVGVLEVGHDSVRDLRQERLVDSQLHSVADGAADKAAQNVAGSKV